MAAPSTEDLVIQMRVDMGRLEADLREANRRLDDLGNAGGAAGNDVQSGMNKARGSVNDFGTAAAAAGTAAAAALAGVIASTLETVEVLNRLAGQTGMATEELQYYAAGAKMLGVDQQELGDVFKDVQDKIGDFLDTGAGGMVDFFEQVAPLVGLTAEEFRHLGGAEALQLVYDSMEKVGLSSNQIVFQMEALASESTRLIPLLKDNGAGFKLFGDEAQRAGAIMSDELILNTTQLKVEMNTLSTELTGARNTIASDLIPTLIDIGNVFGDVSGNGEAMVKVSAAISTAVKVAALTAIGAIGAFKLFGESLAATGTLFQGFDFSKGLIQNMAVVAGNLTRDDSGFAFAMQGLQQTALGVADQINGISLAGLGDEIKRFSAGAQTLTAPGGKGGSGGMRTTQAERDKQAAADKSNAARLEADRKAAATQLENQKAAAEALRKSLLEQLMTERQLIATAANDKMAESLRLTKGLENGEQMHADNMLAIRENYQQQLAALDEREWQAEIEAAAASGTANAEAHEQDMAARIARAEQLREIDARQRLVTEEGKLAAIEENHLLEQELIAELFEEGFISEQERQARLLQLDKDTKDARLNATKELFDGQRELQALYEDTTLKNAANFFAMDLGGFSKYSRKMFEINKAAKIAQVALSIPKAVSDAYDAGNALAGPALGAAYAATALVTKLGQLRDIRAASYGGGGGGGSSGGGGGGSLPQPQEQQQPQIERFVNLSIIGESNDITSIGNVRNLIERINSEIQNGAVLRVN